MEQNFSSHLNQLRIHGEMIYIHMLILKDGNLMER